LCGIFGIVDLGGGRRIDESRFRAGLETLAHRGPDGRFCKLIDDRVMFGHARLSIIDLSDESNQPFLIDGRYWLTYNGEIFNYLELRAELEAAGVRFRTAGDTEVLVRAYEHWGADCVSRFNGMWAFAIYDTETGEVFASRDRFGIKPFNYAVVDGQLLFASEIKAMLHYAPGLAVPHYGMIANFCRTSVGAQHEQTWFKAVKRLQPGHNLTVDASGEIRTWRYWDYPREPAGDPGFEAARDRYAALFEDAVRIRMRSDVPLGITLSAGVDSNSIAYVMQAVDPAPHHSFTARFQDENFTTAATIYKDSTRAVDESVVARRVAGELGLEAHVVDTDYGDLVSELKRIVWHLESGNSSPAVIPLMQLLGEARKRLTVVLDGQGADELLAGYVANVLFPAIGDQVKAGRWRDAWSGLREYLKSYTLRALVLLAARRASNRLPVITRVQQRVQGLEAVYGPLLRGLPRLADYPPLDPMPRETGAARALREQHAGGLVNLLHYGDAVSMANSLEARMPFLDHRLVEFVWPLPDDYKLRMGVGKYVHREAMRGRVDDAILDDHIKHGFSTPISNEFRGNESHALEAIEVLLSERCLSRGVFERRGLEALLAEHRAGKRDHGPLLFRLLSTELWFRAFIDADASAPEPRREQMEPQSEPPAVARRAMADAGVTGTAQ
jgi:asparagine synthase (glutamine-hydrolysing)